MQDGELQMDDSFWTLTETTPWDDGNVFSMLIRENWVRLREFFLSGEQVKAVLLEGKSGRGKTLFSKYFIFHILLEAKRLSASGTDLTSIPEHLIAPRILHVGENGMIHHLTVNGVEILSSTDCYQQPHYYISDNVDILVGAFLGSHLTLAFGDKIREYDKRISEVGGIVAYMQSLSFDEMRQVFIRKGVSEEEIQFKFDVVGGNPRRFANVSESVDPSSEGYAQVEEVVEIMFPKASSHLKQWAINLVSKTLIRAIGGKGTSVTDNCSLFRDYIVLGDCCAGHREVFATTFLGMVASALIAKCDDKLSKVSLSQLLGVYSTDYYFEYTAHLSFLKAKPRDEHFYFSSSGDHTYLRLGGHVKLICNVPSVGNCLQAS